MRIALLYPPPWKIPAPGEAPDTSGDGPPAEYREGDLDADFHQTPYGLFSLGAQALRAGHQVKVLNLSSYPFSQVERVVRSSTRTCGACRAGPPTGAACALVARAHQAAPPRARTSSSAGRTRRRSRPEMLRHHPTSTR